MRRPRCAVAAVGSAAWAAGPAPAVGESAIDGAFVPDVDRFRQDGGVEIPWAAFSVAGAVLLFVTFSALAIFIAGRAMDRRRRRPPQSILRRDRR